MERVVLDKSCRGWWKSAVFYELYPKSFQDTTGSGTGDLRGILSHLDYLETLGVDAIWLCPICASPQVDNGYDISDFCSIEPSFGTMEDMDELIAESKKRGIGILMDLTLNHCSDQHRWFKAARSSKDSPYHDYFLWRDGTPDCPPNEMRGVFGGLAWTYVPEIKQWYFHQFAPEQPDMNWENPKLREELYDVMRFWVKKGVAGFRLDVVDQIAKEPDKNITINGPRLHEYLHGISENVLTDEGLVTVGEAWGADTERAKRYSAPDGSELSMVFQFLQKIFVILGLFCKDAVDDTTQPITIAFFGWIEGTFLPFPVGLYFNNRELMLQTNQVAQPLNGQCRKEKIPELF